MSFYKLESKCPSVICCHKCRKNSRSLMCIRGEFNEIGTMDNPLWHFYWLETKPCHNCNEISFFINATFIEKPCRTSKEFLVQYKQLSSCIAFDIQLDETYLLEFYQNNNIKHYENYKNKWSFLEYQDHDSPSFHKHIFGPYPSTDSFANLGKKILKEISPTLVAISDSRHKEWKLERKIDSLSDDLKCQLLKINGLWLRNIKTPTLNMEYIAVKQNPLALMYVENQTDSIRRTMVMIHYPELDYLLDESKQTLENCLLAVKKCYMTLALVRGYITSEMEDIAWTDLTADDRYTHFLPYNTLFMRTKEEEALEQQESDTSYMKYMEMSEEQHALLDKEALEQQKEWELQKGE